MKDLYYEEHHDTTIMFASIITNDLQDVLEEKKFLAVMNDYIVAFDTVRTISTFSYIINTQFSQLINREEFKTVEKIKVAKWTYLAVCGLFPGDQSEEFERCISKSSLETVLQFVSEMFKKLDSDNKARFLDCQLRVGKFVYFLLEVEPYQR